MASADLPDVTTPAWSQMSANRDAAWIMAKIVCRPDKGPDQ
jgi:hypothetical protein